MFDKTFDKDLKKHSESGASLVIALLIMTVLLGLAAFALSRAASEANIASNDTSESRTFNAAEAALEDATRDFATVVENKLVPPPSDILTIKQKRVPYFEDNGYVFEKKIEQIKTDFTTFLNKGQYQGLISLRDEWRIEVTATDTTTGVQTQVRRSFFNDRIPIFQFGAFYQDDLDLNSPAPFIFNGRVHTNGNFFVNPTGSSDIRFKSKITIGGELIRDRWKTGAALGGSETGSNVYAQNTLNADTPIPSNRGSVTCTSGTGGILVANDSSGRNFPYPNCSVNSAWTAFSANFENNLVVHAKKLELPINKIGNPLIETVRRGKTINDKAVIGGILTTVDADNEPDNEIMRRERYANKEGMRISLADSKDKLPGCANAGSNPCGVQLDGTFSGAYGYTPLPMINSAPAYTTTRVNGNRLAVTGRGSWIKVELVDFDYDSVRPVTTDITEDFLSLGVTEPIIDPTVSKLYVDGYTADTDSRSVIKLQRLAVLGNAIPNNSTNYISNQNITDNSLASRPYNFVVRYTSSHAPASGGARKCADTGGCTADDLFATPLGSTTVSNDERAHLKTACFNWVLTTCTGGWFGIVPFPIQMFDTREGNRSDSTTGANVKQVYTNGVVSLINIDVNNMRRFLRGDFDNNFPLNTPFAVNKGRGLRSTDVPKKHGWVLYVSDRRGDVDFDGRYKMEDVNPTSNSNVDEDINNNGSIDAAASNDESPSSDAQVDAALAAVTDHKYYRRAVRLINGSVLPGNYNPADENTTEGFTVASENGVYVQGNYNVTSVNPAVAPAVTTANRYTPLNTATHIPASVVGDAVTVLSNNWNDAQSFVFPNSATDRNASDTAVRFAMITGDSLTALKPNPTVSFEGHNGGLNNLPRFIEDWTGRKSFYSGSMINIYNAFNNNGRWKCCNTVYIPPTRDWTFEDSFSNSKRLPPGTPFVYFISFTGFERVND